MRYKKAKKALMFWCLFVSIGAIYGSTLMFINPTGKLLGMEELLPYFKVLPFSDKLFQNYIFSGISLLIVNGISNLIAFYYLLKNKKAGIILGSIFGFTLMLWITIQFIILPLNVLSISFFIIGIIQLLTGYMTLVFYLQENFKIDLKKYKNIGKNKDYIVVYFSRMGYTKKIAYEKANELGADILELTTLEHTENTTGFWWCGRYAMHKWNMTINKINVNLKNYKTVIITSPIWVFSICAPIRDFCYRYKSDINNVWYIFNHFMNNSFVNVADEVDNILGIKREKLISNCVRFGKIKNTKELK